MHITTAGDGGIAVRVEDAVKRYWDEDAPTYNRSWDHVASSTAERAAWAAVLYRNIPPKSAVLDVGAGTGFLALEAARLGHHVTAIDLSDRMLGVLRAAALADKLQVEAVVGSAMEPPCGPFDVVVQRYVLWTLPDPIGALSAWRRAAPSGRLILFEGMYFSNDPLEALRARARRMLHRIRRDPPAHHAEYSAELLAELPLTRSMTPRILVELVEASGWGPARLERLRDVEWARRLELPMPERIFGMSPQFVVTAGDN